jgi:hypothetical protein
MRCCKPDHDACGQPSSSTVSHTTATIASSSSAPMTITSSASLTATLVTPLTAAASEKNNHETQDTELRPMDDNMTSGITGMTQDLALTLSGSTPPLASINNNEPAASGQRQSSAKRVKGLAVVGAGLTAKYVGLQQLRFL